MAEPVDTVMTSASVQTNTASSNRVVPALTATEKPGKFFGTDFKRWQQKMLFYLTTLSLQKFISDKVPTFPDDTPEKGRFLVMDAWNHSDFLCRNYILNGLEDSLYNVYSVCKTSKELWDALDKKYKTEDAGLKKFVVAKFLEYKMVDSKTVMSQVQELQVIIHDLLAEGMDVNEAFQVAAFIEKLPPLWKDFKNYLKHKRKEMKLEDLIVRLRIEEDNKAAEKKATSKSSIPGANHVETPPKNKKRKKSNEEKNEPSKKRFKGNCYNCGKYGHMASECRAPKKDKKKKDQANLNEDMDFLCAMLSECNLVGNPKEWWMDSGATRHVCSNRELFSSYIVAGQGETICMANSATTKIEGTGKIGLKMTSGKIVTLNNVLHVPKMRKNLVSTSLLVKNGFKCVFVSDKIVLSKNDMFVGKGYLTEGLFKLSVMAVDINKSTSSSYLLESNNLWHARLGHVNYKTL